MYSAEMFVVIQNLISNMIQNDYKSYKKIKDVNVGDLVMETTSIFIPCRLFNEGRKEEAVSQFKNIVGVLKEKNQNTYVLENLHGELVSWSNCQFVRLPLSLE